MLPIAVDLMGTDLGPAVVARGLVEARTALGVELIAVGTEEALGGLPAEIERVVAPEVIEMTDDPATAPRRKRAASMVVAAELLRQQRASAVVTFGNSGAAMATALLKLGRIRGVARPAITVELPVPGSTATVLLDAGANTEVQSAWLRDFALMGSVYAEARLGIERPRVGILSIGEEPGKGSSLVKEAYALLEQESLISFIGNVEGRDVMSDRVDVVVTDGFTGNVVLKTLEGAASAFAKAVLAELAVGGDDDPVLAGALERLVPLWNELTPDATGAAALLGVDGLFLIGHGASNERAVASAVRNALQLARADVVATIRRYESKESTRA